MVSVVATGKPDVELLSVSQQVFLGYKHLVLVIGMRILNAMSIIPTCLCGIARKIEFSIK